MELGILPLEDPGVFRSLLLPEAADALAAGEPVTALALTEHKIAIGAAAAYLENGRLQICSLYVAPDYRRRGGGTLLVNSLARLAAPYAAGMELRFTCTTEEHQTLPPFLTALGYQELEDKGQNIFLTTLGEAAAAPFFSEAEAGSGKPLSALNTADCSLVKKAALTADAPLPEGGLNTEGLDRDISMVYLNGSQPEAYVLVEQTGPKALTLAAVWSASRNPSVLPMLLRSAMSRALKKYPPETPLAVQATGTTSAALVRLLLAGRKAVSHTYIRQISN